MKINAWQVTIAAVITAAGTVTAAVLTQQTSSPSQPTPTPTPRLPVTPSSPQETPSPSPTPEETPSPSPTPRPPVQPSIILPIKLAATMFTNSIGQLTPIDPTGNVEFTFNLKIDGEEAAGCTLHRRVDVGGTTNAIAGLSVDKPLVIESNKYSQNFLIQFIPQSGYWYVYVSVKCGDGLFKDTTSITYYTP